MFRDGCNLKTKNEFKELVGAERLTAMEEGACEEYLLVEKQWLEALAASLLTYFH